MESKKLYYIIRAVMGMSFFMMFTASALYRIDFAELEVYQLILLGTALEVSIFLFETPTGVLADLKSRRVSVIVGLFIIGLGFILEGLTVLFGVIFLAQVVWGLGYTFISGALDSWISDETNNEGIEKIIISGEQYNKVFSFLGIVLAALIGMYDVRLAIYVSGLLFLLMSVSSIFLMKEGHFHRVEHNESILSAYYSHLTKGFKHIKVNKTLRVMFVVMLFYGLYSEGIDRSYELHILDNLSFRNTLEISPIWIISIVNALVAFTGVIFLHNIKKHVEGGTHLAIWIMYLTVLMVIGVLMFGLMDYKYAALSGFILFRVAREGTYPLLNSLLVRNIPSNIKATVLSTFGQLDAIGQLLSGGLMVVAGLLFGLKGIYILTALLLIVPVILLPRTKESK